MLRTNAWSRCLTLLSCGLLVIAAVSCETLPQQLGPPRARAPKATPSAAPEAEAEAATATAAPAPSPAPRTRPAISAAIARMDAGESAPDVEAPAPESPPGEPVRADAVVSAAPAPEPERHEAPEEPRGPALAPPGPAPDPATRGASALASAIATRSAEGSDVSPEEAIAALTEQISKEWDTLTRVFEPRSERERQTVTLPTATRLLALTFLSDEVDVDPDTLDQAVELAMRDETAPDIRWLAAAYLQRNGPAGEASRLFSDLCLAPAARPVPAAATTDGSTSAVAASAPPASERSTFRIERLAFAKRVDGPGEFVPADPGTLRPGETVLVYGELVGYACASEAADGAGEQVFRRHFEGILKLVGPRGDAIEQVTFLPRDRGVHRSGTRDELVNFWARYDIPSDAEAGSHKLVVTATDVVGGAEASAALQFEVLGDAAASPARREPREAR